jgi:cobalt-zinc-cadmium efflux system protein
MRCRSARAWAGHLTTLAGHHRASGRNSTPQFMSDHDHGSHGHSHDHHSHGHSHVPGSVGRAFVLGIGLNLAFVVVEVVYGITSHSLALLADAGHNVGDVLGLALSWGAAALARVKPSNRRTFGFRRTTIVASVANALILLFVTGGLTWESISRLRSPVPTQGTTIVVVALIGAVVNTASALLFMRDRRRDLNLGSAFFHLASDAVLAVGVAVSGGIILLTGWFWLDPAVSIVLAITILAGTWSLMSKSMNLMLDAVPEGIDPERVKAFLATLVGVVEIHDLHIWAMSTTETALTAHLVMPGNSSRPTFLADACRELHDKFGIEHTTLQIDPEEAPAPCTLASDETV